MADTGYWIFRPERARFLDIFRLLFTRRTLAGSSFVEDSGDQTASGAPLDLKSRFVVAIVLAVQLALKASSGALSSIGRAVEFLLNLPSFNGGTLGLIRRLLTGSVVWPSRDAKEFRSLISYINGPDKLGSVPLPTGDDFSPMEVLHLTILAASKAYDNEANIKDVVNNLWKMHFVEFFNCWNKFLGKKATQAFIFCDKEKDASLICVAFRGTEVFDAADWMTDLDFSYISVGGWKGRVHLGFMKALGLQDERDFAKGFPKEEPAAEDPQGGDYRPLAYYAIRQKLATLLEQHPKATILVTGHSLGGALASLFPALLHLHGQEAILKKMKVVTHAQPRVGDALFARFLTKSGVGDHNFLRTVYRYDMVPRVPPTSRVPIFFKHFGSCVYYTNRYDYQVMEDDQVPNWNYFNPIYNAQMYWSAWVDLFWGVIQWEGIVSVMYRLVGILIPVVGPGIASHSTRNYVNGAAWANRKSKKSKAV